jgi:hypothetical protein
MTSNTGFGALDPSTGVTLALFPSPSFPATSMPVATHGSLEPSVHHLVADIEQEHREWRRL